MLRPATQPGSRVDDVLPPEVVTLAFDSSGPLRVRFPDDKGRMIDASGNRRVEVVWRPMSGELVPIELDLATNGAPPRLEISWHTADDPRPRVLAPSRIFVPWAVSDDEPVPEASSAVAAELAGGDWLRGRRTFFAAEARCSQCHSVRGEGGNIGPD